MWGLPAVVLAPACAGVPVLLVEKIEAMGVVVGGRPLSGGRLAAPATLAMVAMSAIAPESLHTRTTS